MRITKKAIKNCLKTLKNDLLNNPNDYPMIDLYDNKTVRAVLTETSKIKYVNPSYKKSISTLVKIMEDNFPIYLNDGVNIINENDFYDDLNWDIIVEKYKEII
ncbi:hypothetical protein IJE86_05780 [bacterium]|nr:hypothetical protein [bacterium]